MPTGMKNSPWVSPICPNEEMKVPSGANFCTRLLPAVHDVHVPGGVDRHAGRIPELARARCRAAEREQERPGRVELLDALVAVVHDVHVVAAGVGGERDGAVELTGRDAETAPLAEEVAVTVEPLDAIVAGVGHIDLPGRREHDPLRRLELTVCIALGTPGGVEEERRVRAPARAARRAAPPAGERKCAESGDSAFRDRPTVRNPTPPFPTVSRA